MRRLPFLVLVIVLFASIMGCTGDKTSNTAKPPVSRQNISTSNEKQTSSASSSKQGAEVIVKSNNQSSSQEKELVLNEINEEMDHLIDGINSVEDVSDEDLNI